MALFGGLLRRHTRTNDTVAISTFDAAIDLIDERETDRLMAAIDRFLGTIEATPAPRAAIRRADDLRWLTPATATAD